MWRSAGVNLIIKNLPDAVLYAPAADGGVLAGGKFNAYLNGWFNGVDPDDSPMFSCSQIPPNGDNYTRFCDPTVEAAEGAALSAYDRPTRKAAYGIIQRTVDERVPVLFLWFAKRIDVANSDLRGYRPAHAVTTFWNSWEWSI
jgi:ABC-type transport system substrate-binding protein